MIGSPTQAQLDALAPSVAAGVTTASHMLQMMRLGVQYQNAFSASSVRVSPWRR